MSTPLLSVLPAEGRPQAPSPRRSSWRGWLREPLLHFIIGGGLLFAVDHFIVSRRGEARTIVVGANVDREAIEAFRGARGRDPNDEELTALRHVWLDNEVLYREGLALGVDRGDDAIRERVIFKALSVIDSNVKVPQADDNVLRTWFESHRGKYDEPARYDFEEAALSGDTSEATVRAFAKELNGGTPGDAKAGLRVFKGRPHSNLVQSYGADLTKALVASTLGEWTALHTRDGWRAMRLDAIAPGKPAVFETLRGPVQQDWNDAMAAEQRSAAVSVLTKKYTIKHELPVGDSRE